MDLWSSNFYCLTSLSIKFGCTYVGRHGLIKYARRLRVTFLFLLLTCVALSQQLAPVEVRLERLPQDTGARGLDQALRKLKTTARLLQTTAHPDDEDGAMLAFQSRGKGAEVMLMSLTRGDGGQNKTGSNLFDELGVLRTLELLESARYYGVELRFSRAADFGY
ncbi:MAG: hypothetical protein DMG67_15550 [Acidobacteria bacterium]|nr:MAG: hypothetical protein DMG67_15550 [Acidobacteriota bacterium]